MPKDRQLFQYLVECCVLEGGTVEYAEVPPAYREDIPLQPNGSFWLERVVLCLIFRRTQQRICPLSALYMTKITAGKN